MLFNLLNHTLFQTCPLDSEEKESFKKHSLAQHLQSLCKSQSTTTTTSEKETTSDKESSRWLPSVRYLDISEVIFLLVYVIYNKELFTESKECGNVMSSDEEVEAIETQLQECS